MKQAKKNIGAVNYVYLMGLFVSLIYLVIDLPFVYRTERLNRGYAVSYVEEAVQLTKLSMERFVQEEFDTLMAAAVVVEDRAISETDEVFRALVDGLGKYNPYVLMGYAGRDGQTVWIDRYDKEHHEGLSDEDFIARALSGEKVLSEVRREMVTGLDVYYVAVPVYEAQTHAVGGALFAAIPQEAFRDVVSRSLYAGKGLAHIVDGRGEYVVRSDSPLALGVGNNVLQTRVPLDETSQQIILDTFAAGEAGYQEVRFGGENRLVAYAPLAFNGWYVFYAVPEQLVSANLNDVTTGAITMTIVATGAFVSFILLLHHLDKRNRAALETLAFEDPITGHRNFHKFSLDARKILADADGVPHTVIYSDVKSFRYINDLYGRDVGDRMLRYIANFQQITAQEGELSCRLGEDTFVSLIKSDSRREIETRFESAARHVAVFPETFASGYKPELYGGAYILDAADGALTLNDMLDRAIAAQEEVKYGNGPKRFAFYSKEMREQKLWETEIESKMGGALERGEFQVFFQPKIDIQHDDCVFGAEALVRWATPEKGLVPPGRFIELFEKNGFIIELDRFVFERVCQFYREHVLSDTLPPVPISVNVSRLGLMQPDFVGTYTQTKEAYGIPDGCIELEFTENVVLGNQSLFKTVVAGCKRNGFLCSLDDFGSGYSSLNILKSIEVDVLKLDRLFFQYGQDVERGQALVKNMLSMAKDLEMKTVAEGVEERALLEQLRTMGCDAIQGYVFSEPLPWEEFRAFLASRSRCGCREEDRSSCPPQ